MIMKPPKINSVYLSGWEYNRLLQSEPWQPRNSALPGEVLWNGSAQFWLFENIYCTKEALDNENVAGQELNWATGKIFTELSEDKDYKARIWDRIWGLTKVTY